VKQTCPESKVKRITQYAFVVPGFSNYAVADDWLHILKTSAVRQAILPQR